MSTQNERETKSPGAGTTQPWKEPGQSAQDPKNHPPPPPERKEREQRHNETS